MATTPMNPRRQERAESWATLKGGEQARTHRHHATELAELRELAQTAALFHAQQYISTFNTPFSAEDYTQWEEIYVKRWLGAYSDEAGFILQANYEHTNRVFSEIEAFEKWIEQLNTDNRISPDEYLDRQNMLKAMKRSVAVLQHL